MRYLIVFFLFAGLLLQPAALMAQQNNDAELAMQYMQEGEYEKASYYFDKLFARTGLEFYYENLLICYVKLSEFKKAEKLAERQLKRFPQKLKYLVDIGHVLSEASELAKAKAQYDKALKELSPDQKQISELANAFVQRRQLDYAAETYLKGRKLLKGFYPFNMELAAVYKAQGSTDLMIGEYLDMLLIHESYIQSVQNALHQSLLPDADGSKGEILKAELLKRIQKHSDKTVFSELLIWYYVQEKNFTAAFIQSKAIDRRLNEDGYRMMELGTLAYSNMQYDAAIECFEYVTKKGKNNFYFINARMEIVNALNGKITRSGNYTKQDLLKLEESYLSAINELGKSSSTIPLMLGYARLKAFFLYDYPAAITLLYEVLEQPLLRPHDKARTKILLADVYLLTEEIWEASLLYSQVEKDFKYDVQGEEAKFKNAKIAYYTGNFNWAKAQLDVLKGSTSKLIANDALELSLLITDNTTLDTNTVPLFYFAQADLLIYQHKYAEAMLKYDTIQMAFPGHVLADDILFRKAQIMEKQGKYNEAALYYMRLLKDYSFDFLADNALFALAELYEYRLNDKEKAREYYKQILTDFTGSIFTVEARKRYRMLRGDTVFDDFDKLLEN